jgi:ubiquinone biosynthesis protein
MTFKQRIEHLKRYKDLAGLLIKYGQSDIVKQMKLDISEVPTDTPPDPKAEELPGDLEKLGPTYVKLGQFLSTRSDFLPEEYLEALSRLQEKVKPVPGDQIEEILSKELGMRLSKAFEYFDINPMASASIGQVHFARLRSGRAVAVKIQRPNIREQIFDDLDAFEDIATFLENNTRIGKQLMLRTTLLEFRKSMIQELDYLQEAKHLEMLAGNLNEFERIIVPLPVKDYTTSHILTMEFIKGQNIGKLSPIGLMDIDGEQLADELFRAYLKQILVDGFFHADPHPGNIYITDSGNLALIDLGMVSRIPEKMRLRLLRVMMAVGDGDGERAADHLMALGHKEEEADEENFIRKMNEIIVKTNESSLEQIELGRLVMEVTRISAENGIRLPNEIVMLGKALLNLDRAGRLLDPDFNPNEAIRKHTRKMLVKKLRNSFKPENFYELLLDSKALLEGFPSRINEILKLLSKNQASLNVKIVDEKYFVAGIREAANRLTTGIVLAALIVGAALLMPIRTPFMIMGYPGLAIIFFILAAVGGMILVFNVLFKDD